MSKKPQTETHPEAIEVAAEHAGRAARKMFEKATQGEGIDTLSAAIHDEPVKAVMISLGVGVLLGLLIRR